MTDPHIFERVRAAYRDLVAAQVADTDPERLEQLAQRDIETRLEWAQAIEVEMALRRELLRRHDQSLLALVGIALEVGEILQTIGPAVTVLGTRMDEQAADERARIELEMDADDVRNDDDG